MGFSLAWIVWTALLAPAASPRGGVPTTTTVTTAPTRTTSPAPRYRLVVSVSQCRLQVFLRGDEDGLDPVRTYSVGTASAGLAEMPMGKGTVVSIELNPSWTPTDLTRTLYRQKGIVLPPVVTAGDPLNYMGPFKIALSHRTSHGAVYRIHGNNDPSRVGKRITGGCICMNNDEGLELAAMLTVGTEVELRP